MNRGVLEDIAVVGPHYATNGISPVTVGPGEPPLATRLQVAVMQASVFPQFCRVERLAGPLEVGRRGAQHPSHGYYFADDQARRRTGLADSEPYVEAFFDGIDETVAEHQLDVHGRVCRHEFGDQR